MALVCYTGGGSCRACLRRSPPPARARLPSPLFLVSLNGDGDGRRGASHLARARRGLSSRTRRLEERGKKGGRTTTPLKEVSEGEGGGGGAGEGDVFSLSSVDGGVVGTGGSLSTPMPDLPGLQPDFWEGTKWDAFGFVMQYLWAFGIVFALIACGIAVATYNEGATDFKQTTVYKESIQSRELLEEPDSSGSDVFEANPTEEAPALE